MMSFSRVGFPPSLRRLKESTGVVSFFFAAALTCVSCAGTHAGTGVIFEKDAKPAVAATGFSFTEGAACAPDGSLLFTVYTSGTILRLSEAGEVTTAFTIDCWPVGTYMASDGILYVCANKWHRIIAVAPDSTVTAFPDSCEGKLLNGPNDVWVAPDGGVYFTDPRYVPLPEPVEQPGYHVYYIPPDRSTVKRAASDVEMPNGIVGSPDGSLVYVVDTGAGKTFVFTVQPDGTLGGKRPFASAGTDGLSVDSEGNVYIIVKDGLEVYSPGGELIDALSLPENPTNVTFSGSDRQTLSITARKSVFQIRTKVRGL